MKATVELKDDCFVVRSQIPAPVPVDTDSLAEVLRRTIQHVADGNVFDLLLQDVKVYDDEGRRIRTAVSKDGRYRICR